MLALTINKKLSSGQNPAIYSNFFQHLNLKKCVNMFKLTWLWNKKYFFCKIHKIISIFTGKKLQQYFCVIKWRDWSAGQTRRVKSSALPQTRVFILDFFVKTVGYFNKNDKTIWSYPFFLIRTNIFHVKLQPHMQALVTSRLGWQLKIFVFDSTRDSVAISASCELEIEDRFSDAAIRPWEMHILYNPDGIVKILCHSSFAVDKFSSALQ